MNLLQIRLGTIGLPLILLILTLQSITGSASPQNSVGPTEDLSQWNIQTHAGLDLMVSRGIFELRSEGDDNLATDLEQEYDSIPRPTASYETLELGDHEPLSPYLDRLYLVLVERLGSERVRSLHLDDLKIANYAIPVAFQPCGDRRNGETWSQKEYQLHFVPLSGAVTYWTTFSTCSSGSWGPITDLLCTSAAELARQEMEIDLAPAISDELYQQAQESCH